LERQRKEFERKLKESETQRKDFEKLLKFLEIRQMEFVGKLEECEKQIVGKQKELENQRKSERQLQKKITELEKEKGKKKDEELKKKEEKITQKKKEEKNPKRQVQSELGNKPTSQKQLSKPIHNATIPSISQDDLSRLPTFKKPPTIAEISPRKPGPITLIARRDTYHSPPVKIPVLRRRVFDKGVNDILVVYKTKWNKRVWLAHTHRTKYPQKIPEIRKIMNENNSLYHLDFDNKIWWKCERFYNMTVMDNSKKEFFGGKRYFFHHHMR